MPVSFQLNQVSTLSTDFYRVRNEVTAAEGCSPAVFVYKTVTQEFSHFATVADIERWPDTYEQAVTDDDAFYRKVFVQRDHTTVGAAEADLSLARRRLNFLAAEMNAVQDDFLTDETVVITGD